MRFTGQFWKQTDSSATLCNLLAGWSSYYLLSLYFSICRVRIITVLTP